MASSAVSVRVSFGCTSADEEEDCDDSGNDSHEIARSSPSFSFRVTRRRDFIIVVVVVVAFLLDVLLLPQSDEDEDEEHCVDAITRCC